MKYPWKVMLASAVVASMLLTGCGSTSNTNIQGSALKSNDITISSVDSVEQDNQEVIDADVIVKVEGKQIRSFPLCENTTYTIHGANNGINELIIEDGQVWIKEADCPKQICVNQGKICDSGENIICLPHKVAVTIQSKSAVDSVDAIVQ